MKVLAFAGSSSQKSINKQLAIWTAKQIKSATLKVLDLNDFEMPIFSVDLEAKIGPQKKAKQFIEEISLADYLVVSLAEHNGSYSTAFKNILDWSSRINSKLFQNKPMILMATSPGVRGGASVMEAAKVRFAIFGADIKGSFSLPEFTKNFNESVGITNPDLLKRLQDVLAAAIN